VLELEAEVTYGIHTICIPMPQKLESDAGIHQIDNGGTRHRETARFRGRWLTKRSVRMLFISCRCIESICVSRLPFLRVLYDLIFFLPSVWVFAEVVRRTNSITRLHSHLYKEGQGSGFST